MEITTKDIRTKVTPSGDKVVAFKISDADYNFFMKNFNPEKKYRVSFDIYFDDKTFNQRAFFNAHIRELSKKMRMNFDELYALILTEDGIEVTEKVGNIEVQKVMYVSNDISSEQVIENLKKQHLYAREIPGEGEYKRFRIFKGVKFMDSREMSIVIDRLINRCNDAGVATISADEYKRLIG